MKKKCREMNIPLKRLQDEAMRAFCTYPWPGNVRELENVIERTVVLSDHDTISLQDVPLIFDEGDEMLSHPQASRKLPRQKPAIHLR